MNKNIKCDDCDHLAESCFMELNCIVCGLPIKQHDTVDYILLKHIIWHCSPVTCFCFAIAGDCSKQLPEWYQTAFDQTIGNL